MLHFFTLLCCVQAHRIFPNNMPRHTHSVQGWLEEWLVSYPVVATLITFGTLAILFVLFSHCKKRLNSSPEVKTLLVSRRLAEAKPLKV